MREHRDSQFEARMKALIEGFLSWWTSGDAALAGELFHKDLRYTGAFKHQPIYPEIEPLALPSDLVVSKTIVDNDEALIIFEETDVITDIFYRYAIYFRAVDNKLLEVIETKQRIYKE